MIAEDNPAMEAKLGMDKETYDFFIAGLRLAIKEAKLTQKEFADGIMDQVTLSNNLTGKRTMIEENIFKCAKKLNKDVSDIVLIGKTAEAGEGKETQASALIAPSIHVDVDNFLAAAWGMAAQYRKADKDQKWWKEVFDMLPSPTLIVEDETVIHQNKPSEIWGKLVGKTIYEIRLDEDESGDECPLKMAIETKQESSLCKYIRDDYYKVVASPFRYHGRDIFVVTCTEINETVGGFRRDRRADVRRDEDKKI